MVARALRDAANIHQPWRGEGPARHLIRQGLCLQGCRWGRADERARILVARARSIVNGVPAPRGWDHNDLSLYVGRAECAVCDKLFLLSRPGHIYCSHACAERARRMQAYRPVLARCAHCDTLMEAPRPDQTYCSSACLKQAWWARQKAVRPERPCARCGATIPPEARPDMRYCTPRCARATASALRRARRANGHVSHAGAEGFDTALPPERRIGPQHCPGQVSSLHDQGRKAGRERRRTSASALATSSAKPRPSSVA